MRRKRYYFMLFFAVLAATGYLYISRVGNQDVCLVSPKAYFPKKKMLKVFRGGFENAGVVHLVDGISEERGQIKQLDTGTGVIFVYAITSDYIKLVYSREQYEGILEENFMDAAPNIDRVILKAPIANGTKWRDNYGEYEIRGLNVEVTTPYKDLKCIEVTYKRDEFIVKRYYSEGLGLVKEVSKYGSMELVKVECDLDRIKDEGDMLRLLKSLN